jgi:plasmid stabilization system protein ParE
MGAYLSPAAEADLEKIFEHIKGESPQNAGEFLDRVEHALTRIAKNPQALRLRDDELPMAGLRIASAVPARLVYRVLDDGEVEVVRIAHDKQDLPALMAFIDE